MFGRKKHKLEDVEVVETPPTPKPQPSAIPPTDLGAPLPTRDARVLVISEILRDDSEQPNAWIDLLKGVGNDRDTRSGGTPADRTFARPQGQNPR